MKNKRILWPYSIPGYPGGAWLIAALIVLGCSGTSSDSRIQRKSLPDLNYIYLDDERSFSDIESGIAACLEIYSSAPLYLGDPIAVIEGQADSSGLSLKRNYGLILADTGWVIPSGVARGTVNEGKALYSECPADSDSLRLCWNEIFQMASQEGYTLIPPGIEIYPGFAAESSGGAITQARLMIRIDR